MSIKSGTSGNLVTDRSFKIMIGLREFIRSLTLIFMRTLSGDACGACNVRERLITAMLSVIFFGLGIGPQAVFGDGVILLFFS